MQRFTTFALNIFMRYSGFSNIRKHMYNLKITCMMPHGGNNIKKNVNTSPREIANFCKFAIIHRRENVNVHSI